MTDLLQQFAVTVEFIDFVFVPWQHANHRFTLGAQAGNGSTQASRFAPGRTDGRMQASGHHRAHKRLHIEAEPDGRTVTAKVTSLWKKENLGIWF